MGQVGASRHGLGGPCPTRPDAGPAASPPRPTTCGGSPAACPTWHGAVERQALDRGLDVLRLGGTGRHFHDTVVAFLQERKQMKRRQGPRGEPALARQTRIDYYSLILPT